MMAEKETSKLAEALVKAQSAIKSASKDSLNPHFKSKYADLASVWDACREALTSNGLCVVQEPTVMDGVTGLRTKLKHVSGEVEESFLPLYLPPNANMQQVGSALTYARRYTLAAMVGVVADEDDDGNAASQPPKPPVDRFQAFWNAIASANNEEVFDGIIRKGALLTNEIANTDKEKHAKLLAFIAKRREELTTKEGN